MVEHLPIQHKTLGSTPSTTKRERKKKMGELTTIKCLLIVQALLASQGQQALAPSWQLQEGAHRPVDTTWILCKRGLGCKAGGTLTHRPETKTLPCGPLLLQLWNKCQAPRTVRYSLVAEFHHIHVRVDQVGPPYQEGALLTTCLKQEGQWSFQSLPSDRSPRNLAK